MRSVVRVMAGVGFLALAAAPVVAEEARSQVSAALILNALRPGIEPRDAAFDESLKDAGPAPRSPLGEVLPDGSVRYGNVTVTVKNPCPPGTAHYEPPPLPGRRLRK